MEEIKVREAKTDKGLELKIARLRAGLKQYEVAAKVGIAPTQLCEIEMGRREPPPEPVQPVLIVLKGDADGQG